AGQRHVSVQADKSRGVAVTARLATASRVLRQASPLNRAERFREPLAPGRSFRIRIIAAAAVMAGSILTWRQIPMWHDPLSFWQRVIEVQPSYTGGYLGRANARIARHEDEKAIGDFRYVIAHEPQWLQPRNDLAWVR